MAELDISFTSVCFVSTVILSLWHMQQLSYTYIHDVITPHPCTRSEVIGRVIVVIIMDTKIAKSGDLSTDQVVSTTNMSNLAKKLASLCLESRGGSRGGLGGSDKPPWAPKTTHCMYLSDLV